MSASFEHIDDERLARFLDGGGDADERAAVAQWIEANPDAFARFQLIWEKAATSTPQPAVDVDAAWAKMQARMAASASNGAIVRQLEPETQQQAPRVWLRVAAAAVLVLAAAATLWVVVGESAATTVFAANETVVHTLPDGSVVTLNTNSSLQYGAFEAGQLREVWLTGEAFFEVHRDTTRPFSIHTGEIEQHDGARITVLGTSFNIRAYPAEDSVALVVATGKVAFEPDYDLRTVKSTTPLVLTAGTKAVFQADERTVEKAKAQAPAELFWRNKTIVFENTGLATAAQVLSELYGAEIVLTNDAQRNCVVTTTFENETLEYVISVIASTLGLEVVQQGNHFELRGHGC